ncbi:MoaD/ThiS family protein [Methylonatrum kenyense]|uniref:MoaD/ThiS family protein n=1 Tax=Methylonatrum kenyense TaxID=455253 RepID=UPI0020C0F2CD|nr:MoaD/ThiS family protein [Methylonatrum kenyense]MCK8514829.1 MoaD/ThiS family protein [Methylonatrum kenyense]
MLTVELFGVLQQAAGDRQLQLDALPEPPTVAAVLDQLARRHPALAPHLRRVACAQGDSLVRQDQTIDTSRPLVLLPPVSGG